jgi:hypothetical protein
VAAVALVHPVEDPTVAPALGLRPWADLEKPEPPPPEELRPQIDPKWALRWQHLTVAALFSAIYVLVSYLPLHHAVTWRHVAIGKTILTSKTLPLHEPYLPLAEGIDTRTYGWLSQAIMAKAFEVQQGQGVATLLAVSTTAVVVLFGVMAFARSGRRRFAMLMAVSLVAAMWPWLTIARPEVFGLACFASLLLIATSLERNSEVADSRLPAWLWLAVPALFALWANLDGTVVLGVGFFGLLAIGQCVDGWRKHGQLTTALRNGNVQSIIYLAEIALLASLLQPNGLALWSHAMGMGKDSLWTALGGLRPLVLTSTLGIACAIIWLMAAILLRLSPRQLRATDALLFIAASVLVAVNVQWATWFVAVSAYVLLPHAVAASDVNGWLKPRDERPVFEPGQPAPSMAFVFTLLSVLCVWAAFALTPASNFLLGGKPRKLERVHSAQTPLRVAAFLNQEDGKPQPIKGLVWAPEDWGDWLALAGEGRYSLAMNSNLAALPPRVIVDAAAVARADANWSKTLDRYGVAALVVDKERQPRLAEAVLGPGGGDWIVLYEDASAILLQRKEG